MIRNKIIDRIKEYTELGYTLREISEFITEYRFKYLFNIKNAYTKENGWYTKEELEIFAVQRKAREDEEAQRIFESLPPEEKQRIEEEKIAESKRIEEEKKRRQEEIIARRQERKDETNKRHKEDVEELKRYLKSGKTMEEATKLMKFSISYAYRIRKESMQNNTWFTLEELKAIEKEKKKISLE